MALLIERKGRIPVEGAPIVLWHFRERHPAVVGAIELCCLGETWEDVPAVSIENAFAAIWIGILSDVEFRQIVTAVPYVSLQARLVVGIDDVFVDAGKIVILQLLARVKGESRRIRTQILGSVDGILRNLVEPFQGTACRTDTLPHINVTVVLRLR